MSESGNEIREKIKEIIQEKNQGCKEFLNRKLWEFQQIFDSKVINPWELLDFLGIELYRGDLSGFGVRGFFKLDQNRVPQICYDQNLVNPQLRYTIMHEVAHKLLLDYVSENFLSDIEKENTKNLVYDQVSDENIQLNSNDLIEKLCDDFAIEALMPKEVLRHFKERQGGMATNRRIAEYFGIEEELIENYCWK